MDLGYFLYNLSVKAIGPTRASSSVYSLVRLCCTNTLEASYSKTFAIGRFIENILCIQGFSRFIQQSRLVPVFVALLAFAFFRQPITALMLFSISLIILGLHFALKSKSRG